MDVSLALHNIDKNNKNQQKVIKSVLIGIFGSILFLFLSPFFMVKMADIEEHYGYSNQAWNMYGYAEFIQHPRKFYQKMDDSIYIETAHSFISPHTDNHALTKKWCSDYLQRSLFWMPEQTIFHANIRMGRVMCLDIMGDKASALAESRVYLDEMASGTFETQHSEYFNDLYYPYNTRFSLTMRLLLSVTDSGLFSLADDLYHQGALYRSPTNISLKNYFNEKYNKVISKRTQKDLTRSRENCQEALKNSGSSTIIYFCMQRGYLHRQQIKKFQVD